MLHFLVAAILAQATPSPGPSATPSVPTDPCGSILSIINRPTVITGTCTVRDGHAVLETGYTNTITTGPGGGSTVSYPQSFVRVGIGQHLEMSFTPPSFNRSSVGGAIATGSSDMNMGLKWEGGYNEKAFWGANVQVSAPTGDPAFTAGGTQYTGNLNWSYALGPVWSVSGTFGSNSLVSANATGAFQRYSAFIPGVEITSALPGNSQAFAEYAYFSHAGPGFGSKSIIDFGYQRDFGQHVQFDIEYGFQPNAINGQRQHYIGAGLSFMT